MFEPPMPKDAAYMAPSKNCMGVLLLQMKKKKKVIPNPVVESLNIVYTPSEETQDDDVGGDLVLGDPSGIPVSFKSAKAFSAEEKVTR